MQAPATTGPGAATAPPPAGKLRRLFGHAAFVSLALIAVLLALWSTAALYFDFRVHWLRVPIAFVYFVALAVIWIKAHCRWLKLAITAAGFAIVLGWWLTLRPSNNRDWQRDVATLAYADINANQITMHNIRNCDYRTETD